MRTAGRRDPDPITPSGLNRAALNEAVNRAIKADPKSGSSYSFGKSLAGAWEKGWNQFAQAGGNTFAMLEDALLAPLELLQGMQPGDLSNDAPFNTWARSIRGYEDTLEEKYRENMAAGGKPAETVENLGAAAIAALPQAVSIFGSMGGTVAAKGAEGLARLAASETAPSVAGTLANGLTDMVRNPQYWSSFAQVAGNGYEKALADLRARAEANGEPVNEGEIRRKAMYYAVGNGLMSAAVEIGGGIQNLPKQLQNGSSAWLAWLDSTAGEGAEEVWQGVIERAMENVVYNQDNPMFSTEDPRAVLNPLTSAKEFGGGFAVGGLLGGIPAVVNAAANRAGKITGRGAEQVRVDEDAFLEGFLDGDGEAARTDWGAAVQADGGGGLAPETGGLLAVPDLQELYVSALQNPFGRLRAPESWMADRAASMLYQEYFRRAYGEQSVIPLLPEWRGGGLEDTADIEDRTLAPTFPDSMKTEAEAVDRKEFAEFQAVLGNDAPKSLAEFLDLKYNHGKEWEYAGRFVEYIRKYPNSDKRYFDIQEQLRTVKGKSGVVLPPAPKQAFILPSGTYDPYHIMNRMTDRGITDDEIRLYMRDAKIRVIQWGGQRQLFIGEKGMCLIVRDGNVWKFRTAWKACDYDESSDRIMEAIKNAGL